VISFKSKPLFSSFMISVVKKLILSAKKQPIVLAKALFLQI